MTTTTSFDNITSEITSGSPSGNSPAHYPEWAARSQRALGRMDVPRLATLNVTVMDRLRPLAVLLIVRPLVAVGIFIGSALAGWWPLAVVSTWLVYGASLTAVHHLIHGSLDLTPKWRRFWLSALGILVAESGHALQVTHLAHHRRQDNVPDPEGYIENVSWTELPLAALKFRYRLAMWGFRYGPRRRRIAVELAIHAAAHIASLLLLPVTVLPWIYLSLIHLASFAFALLAGKGPQTNYGRSIDSPYVRVRTRLGQALFFSHDQHLEHHAYPRVPLSRLRRLHPHLQPVFDEMEIVEVEMPL